ncbi:MAG: zinc metallopeptidase [Pseudomonadota bacterium]
MPILILILVVSAIWGPGLWAQYILKKHSTERPELPGNGGELAAHLIEACGLSDVSLEKTDGGDHYDPMSKTVRLSADNYEGKSLTAITVAAHEVGHAIQDHIGYAPLRWRTRLVGLAQFAEKFGAVVLIAMPLVTVLARTPVASVATLGVGLSIMLVPVIVHFITLPVEYDASFNRALPILHERYIPDSEMHHARSILRACALTYVAASLATLLNVWRWIAILRR